MWATFIPPSRSVLAWRSFFNRLPIDDALVKKKFCSSLWGCWKSIIIISFVDLTIWLSCSSKLLVIILMLLVLFCYLPQIFSFLGIKAFYTFPIFSFGDLLRSLIHCTLDAWLILFIIWLLFVCLEFNASYPNRPRSFISIGLFLL